MKSLIPNIRITSLILLLAGMFRIAGAQYMYYNIDWQINTPVGSSFADKTSGWGANFEGGYFVLPQISVGGFIAFHTNNKYIDRQTIETGETSSVTSDQQHSIYQLPFGASVRYNYTNLSLFEPYAGVRLGASFSEAASYMNILKAYEKTWGFYVAPEIGLNIFFSQEKKWGIHVAVYYNYATNKSKVLNYSLDGLNNWGARIGVTF